jgi:hypothetical protein
MKIREELHAEMKSHLERQEAAQRARQEAERYDTQVASASKLAFPPSLVWHYMHMLMSSLPHLAGRVCLEARSRARRDQSARRHGLSAGAHRGAAADARAQASRGGVRACTPHMHASLIACTPL